MRIHLAFLPLALSCTLAMAIAGCTGDERSPTRQLPGGGDGGPADGQQAGCRDEDGDGFGVGPACAVEDLPDRNGVVDANDRIYPNAAEICDGEDNDGNGLVDLDDPRFLRAPCELTQGICAGRGRPCVNGRSGSCDYGPDYVEEETTLCDGKDNDCDGEVDEGGCECRSGDNRPCGPCGDGLQSCHEGSWGRCLGGSLPQAEVCNGRDDDCNQTPDDGGVCGRCPFEMAYVQKSNLRFCIDRWEASRSDASEWEPGTDDAGPAHSRPGKQPWAMVSWSAARSACDRAGKLLCTSLQWQAACRAAGGHYPYGSTYQPGTCNDATGRRRVVATGSYPQCAVQTDRPIFDLSGNVREWLADFHEDGREAVGGTYLDDGPSLSCTSSELLNIGLSEEKTGFRCCLVRS